MRIGFSFSKKQCDWLNLDWQDTLQKLDSQKLEIVRLSVYWSDVEKKRGVYDFSQIESEINLATKLGKSIILTVGMKAQRWPEFYIPDIYKSKIKFSGDVSKNKVLNESTRKYVQECVKKLKKYENIFMWQVENEPLDPQWPENTYISLEFLQELVALVDKFDNRPKMVNCWGNNLKERDTFTQLAKLKNVNTLGFDFYSHQFDSDINTYRGPDLSIDDIEDKVDLLKQNGFNIAIAELQAEPWEDFDYRMNRSKIKSTSLEKIESNIKKFSTIKPEFTLLWGSEYWVWSGLKDEVLSLL
jgi:beta-galactosidase GanA